MKKTTISIIVGLLIFCSIILALFLPIYFSFFGNPINKFIKPNEMVKIIEERYDEEFKVIHKYYSYSVDYQNATVLLQSRKNPSIEFEATTDVLDTITSKTVSDNYVEKIWEKKFNKDLKTFLDKLLPGVPYTTENSVIIPPFQGINENGDILPYGDENAFFVPSIFFSKDFGEENYTIMKEIVFFVQDEVDNSSIYLKFNDGPQYVCGGNSKEIFVEGDDLYKFCVKPYE